MTMPIWNEAGLREMLVQSFSEVLQDHIAEVSRATRARLAQAALELRAHADWAPAGFEDPTITAARRLEAIACEDVW